MNIDLIEVKMYIIWYILYEKSVQVKVTQQTCCRYNKFVSGGREQVRITQLN